jgi:hypothetical protein
MQEQVVLSCSCCLLLLPAPAPGSVPQACALSSQNLAVLSQVETNPLQNLRLFTWQAASQCSPDKDLAAIRCHRFLGGKL